MFAKACRVLFLTLWPHVELLRGDGLGVALAVRSVTVWWGVILSLLRPWTDPAWKLLPGHLLGWESFWSGPWLGWRWCGAGTVPYLSCSPGTIHPAWLARGELFEVPASLI